MEIFPGVFNGCMNNFHGNISMALNTNTANLGVTGSNPKQNKNNLQGKKTQCTLQVSPIQKVKVQTNIQKMRKNLQQVIGDLVFCTN
jgi:hypothetical protein